VTGTITDLLEQVNAVEGGARTAGTAEVGMTWPRSDRKLMVSDRPSLPAHWIEAFRGISVVGLYVIDCRLEKSAGVGLIAVQQE
jgi:hypothetical protein